MGISTIASAVSRNSCETPSTSFPNTNATSLSGRCFEYSTEYKLPHHYNAPTELILLRQVTSSRFLTPHAQSGRLVVASHPRGIFLPHQRHQQYEILRPHCAHFVHCRAPRIYFSYVSSYIISHHLHYCAGCVFIYTLWQQPSKISLPP